MKKRLERVHSPQLGRAVSLWSYGHWGPPLVVFPDRGRFRPRVGGAGHGRGARALDRRAAGSSSTARSRTSPRPGRRRENDAAWRIQRHVVYERFVIETLVPKVREDCNVAGHPARRRRRLARRLLRGEPGAQAPGDLPLGAVHERPLRDDPLHRRLLEPRRLLQQPARLRRGTWRGEPLDRVRRNTHLRPGLRPGRVRGGLHRGDPGARRPVRPARAFPHDRDIWGHDVAHNWAWWKRQAQYHLAQRFGMPD